MQNRILLKAVARILLSADQTPDQIVLRSSETLGRRWQWLRPLVLRYLKTFAGDKRPRLRDVIHFLRHDHGWRRAKAKYGSEITVVKWQTPRQTMRPVSAARAWRLPEIESPAALAEWLMLDLTDLLWFTDLKGLEAKGCPPRTSHYHYIVQAKRSGGLRLIEAPKQRLKALQRQVLSQILEQIPAHPAAHGFVRERSIQTFVSPHLHKSVVLRMDLENFFPSFIGARVQTFFRILGYPETVANHLGGICTNATPGDVWTRCMSPAAANLLHEEKLLYSRPHLPQGAPTSPALANLCMYRIGCRLTGLAKSAGAAYTRYADDLAFSGDKDFERRADRFSTHVGAVLLEEGLQVHHRKTRVMRKAVRQQLAGLVLNSHPNIRRREFDLLKAILTNCARYGPDSQNREYHSRFRLHLEGRVRFAESINPVKGHRLREIFDKIQWPLEPERRRSGL